jgi:hypothetical protein
MALRWVDCFENTNYEVSTEGKLRNKKTSQILEGFTPPNGYKRFKINNKYYTASNVIYKSFNNVEITGDIIHLDRDKKNLNINNLKMVPRAEACDTLRQSNTVRCNNNTGHTNIYQTKRGRYIVAVNKLKSKSFLNLDEAIIYKNTIFIGILEDRINNIRINRNNVSLPPNTEVII